MSFDRAHCQSSLGLLSFAHTCHRLWESGKSSVDGEVSSFFPFQKMRKPVLCSRMGLSMCWDAEEQKFLCFHFFRVSQLFLKCTQAHFPPLPQTQLVTTPMALPGLAYSIQKQSALLFVLCSNATLDFCGSGRENMSVPCESQERTNQKQRC